MDAQAGSTQLSGRCVELEGSCKLCGIVESSCGRLHRVNNTRSSTRLDISKSSLAGERWNHKGILAGKLVILLHEREDLCAFKQVKTRAIEGDA